MHFIPAYSSWLIQVERFVSLITDKAIRRGSFTIVKQLVQGIDQLVAAHNVDCQLSSGPPPLIRFSKSCIDFARLSAGQHTSSSSV